MSILRNHGVIPCRRIRVLMYHRVVPEGSPVRPHTRTVTVDVFRRHMELLERWGYTPITFHDHSLIHEGKLLPPRKPIIITFDDGYSDTYEQALPVLQEYGMHAVVFVTADPEVRSNGWDRETNEKPISLMKPEELIRLHDSGFEIGSHSMTHPRLPMLSREKVWEEIYQSRLRLESLLNAPVHSFAYPYGLYNTTLKSLVRDAGYRYACSAWSGPTRFLADPYEIRRIEVSDSTDPVQFGMKILGPYPLFRSLTGRSSWRSAEGLVEKHLTQTRTLLLVSGGLGWPNRREMERREAGDLNPRVSPLLNALNAEVVNEEFLASAPFVRRMLYRILPLSIAQILEASIVAPRYDAIVSWAEHLGIPLATLLTLTGTRFPHVGIFSWISRPKKAVLLRFARSSFNRIVLMSSRQRDLAVKRIGISPKRIAFLRWPVDLRFWRPEARPAEMICAVGREMRDYGTLVEALRGSSIPCHIAAGGQGSKKKKDPWIEILSSPDQLPPNITVGPKNFVELRELYRRSMFVVMPLYPTKTDNGTTSILEAMAMGKTVICSGVDGQRDVIRDGETGILVPPGDPGALRKAIEYLWAHPEEAEKMGRAARAHVERFHSLDDWVKAIRQVVDESVLAHRSGNLSVITGDLDVS